MEQRSELSAHGRITLGKVAVLLLAACLSMALASCSSSSAPPATSVAKVNQHLAYQNLLDKDATLKPNQTAVLNLSSLVDDHLSVGPGSSYHNLPYEISNAGKYKYCIPDSDTHLTQIELFDPEGALVGNWKKGEACAAVPLVPGRYKMHVHLNSTESDPPIFMKPHDVTVTQTGTPKAARKSVAFASYSGPIPYNQFRDLKVDTLTDILRTNKTQGLSQGWGLLSPSSESAYYELTQPQLHDAYFGKVLDSPPTTQVPKLGVSDMFYIQQQEGGKVSLFQGVKPAGIFQNICVETHYEERPICGPNDDTCINGGYHQVLVCGQTANVIGLLPSNASQDKDSWFSLSPSAFTFTLADSGSSPVKWYSGEWVTGTGTNPVNFNVKVRYGTTSGTLPPAMLANEVALFDSSYGQSGFPANTHYWIINADMKNFNDFAFDNPDQRIKTVIAGRGVRAQLFQNPSFQGDSVYVSPLMDKELLMTGTDNDLLNKGTIGSIRFEPNTNDISFNSYEYHIVASAKTCIGCDLRGFNLSSISSKSANISGLNFADSDLSNAMFSVNQGEGGLIYYSDFTRTNFNGATLSNNYFFGCNFTGTNFTKAVLQKVTFDAAVNRTMDINSKVKIQVSNSFYNSCPKFESTDLTTVSLFQDAFYIGNGTNDPDYKAATWWNNGQPLCRTSLANSKVTADLFKNKNLWQFVNAPGADFSNMNLDGAVFAGSNLTGAKFINASLKGAVFTKATLTNADLTGADLGCVVDKNNNCITGTHLEGAMLAGVDLKKAKSLKGVYLSGVTLNAPDLSGTDMSYALLTKGSYTNWDKYSLGEFAEVSLKGAVMVGTNLSNADVRGVDFSGADLGSAKFNSAVARSANFSGANLTSASFKSAILDSSSSTTDYYTKAATLSGAILEGTDFSSAILSTADFSNAGFSSGTSFKDAILDGAKFNGAWLAGVDFSTNPPASMLGVSFYQAYLMNAILSSRNMSPILTANNNTPSSFYAAYLHGAKLDSADLTAANLSQALLSFTSGNISKPRPRWDSVTKKVEVKNWSVSYQATTTGSVKTTHDTTCPDGSNGPCTTQAQWTYTPTNNDGPVINPDQ